MTETLTTSPSPAEDPFGKAQLDLIAAHGNGRIEHAGEAGHLAPEDEEAVRVAVDSAYIEKYNIDNPNELADEWNHEPSNLLEVGGQHEISAEPEQEDSSNTINSPPMERETEEDRFKRKLTTELEKEDEMWKGKNTLYRHSPRNPRVVEDEKELEE